MNGTHLPLTVRDDNPYRAGGWRVPAVVLAALLGPEPNVIEIEL